MNPGTAPLNSSPQGNQNQFFGQKISQLGISVNDAGDNQLLYKNDYNNSLETYYGTQGPVLEIGKIATNSYGIALVNASGELVAQYGEQLDGTVNLKFFDTNGIGIAQFGQFSDGEVALKVAKPGVEVATAPDSELIFNSNQDIFKIVTKVSGSITVSTGGGNPFNPTATTPNQWTQRVSVSHGQTAPPTYLAFVVPPSTYKLFNETGTNLNLTVPFRDSFYFSAQLVTVSGDLINGVLGIQQEITAADAYVDSTNVTFQLRFNQGSNSTYNVGAGTEVLGQWTFVAYILQESIT